MNSYNPINVENFLTRHKEFVELIVLIKLIEITFSAPDSLGFLQNLTYFKVTCTIYYEFTKNSRSCIVNEDTKCPADRSIRRLSKGGESGVIDGKDWPSLKLGPSPTSLFWLGKVSGS